MKLVLVLFGLSTVVGSILFFIFNLIKINNYKRQHKGKLYFISSYRLLVFASICFIIAIGNTVSIVISNDMTYILYVAMVLPFCTNEIIDTILVISDVTMLMKNKIYSYGDIEKIDLKENSILGKQIKIQTVGKSEKIIVFVTEKGKNIIDASFSKISIPSDYTL